MYTGLFWLYTGLFWRPIFHVMLCSVLSCHVGLCFIMLGRVDGVLIYRALLTAPTLCYVMLYYLMYRALLSLYIGLFWVCTGLFWRPLRCVMWCCIILCHARPCHVMLAVLMMHLCERWGAGVETQKNVRGEIEGWGRVPFNAPYAPSLITIYDGA